MADEIHGPKNPSPCYSAPCGVCHRAVRGIMFMVEYVRWRVGSRNGLSFFYYHTKCFRAKHALRVAA